MRLRLSHLAVAAPVVGTGCSIYTEDLLVGQDAPASDMQMTSDATGGVIQASTGGGTLASGGTGNSMGPTGGTGPAMGGAPVEPPPIDPCEARETESLLANFDDGTTTLALGSGRSGSWFLFNDGSGTQTPVKPGSGPMLAEQPGACGTSHGFRTTASGFTSWGAGIGVDLLPKVANEKQPEDLSAYSGFSFFARANATLVLRVSWSDVNTAEEGGVCDPAAGSGEDDRCGDYFGKDVIIGTEWALHEVSFDELRQRGFGLPIATGFDSSAVYSFRAQSGGQESFEFSVDELFLVPSAQ